MILAAGEGARFGGDKLLARVNGAPLLQRAIDAACGSGALSCTLVLGAGADRVRDGVDLRRAGAIVNHEWRTGLASSIRCGLRMHGDDDACLIALGDQPFVTSADLDRLIVAWSGREQRIVALRAGEVWGAPALFPRRDFAALRRLTGDNGAKRYAALHKDRLVFVEAEDARAFDDVDTRADLKRLSGRGTRRTRP